MKIKEDLKDIRNIDLKDIVYTAKEAGNILKIPYGTVMLLIRRGDLPFLKVGRQYRITRKSLLKWIYDNEENIY